MRIKDLFTVPTGQKVTEKHLRRVLISSVCSILLCMSCLVGTTWAWFTVSIENTGNVILIGSPAVIVTKDGVQLSPEVPLDIGENKVLISNAGQEDDLQQKSTLLVTLTIQSNDETKTVNAILHRGNSYSTEVVINCDQTCTLSWMVTWYIPAAGELSNNPIHVMMEAPTEPTEETTEAEESAEPEASEEEEGSTESEEPAEPEDTTTTEPTTVTEPTTPTEPTTATDPTTSPPTESTPATESEELSE